VYTEASLYVAHGNLIIRKLPHSLLSSNVVLASSDNTIRTMVVYKNDMFYAPVHGHIMKHKNVLKFSSIAFNTDAEEFVAIDEAEKVKDMAVDWVGEKLYWTTFNITTLNGTIYCSDAEHPKITIVATSDSGLGRLGEIALHPKSQ